MSSAASIPPPARTWRDIQQDIAPRSMSREGRRRLAMATFKSIAAIVVLGVSVWGGYEIFRTWETNPAKLRAPVKSDPIKEITLRTDGALDRAWIERTLALPKGIGLMELDLFALRDRLQANPQVRTAVLTRRFSENTLAIVLEERSPVARILVQVGEAPASAYLVAPDGVMFAGTGYTNDVVERLPYLDGVPLKPTGKGFAPVQGMERVDELLRLAQANIPAIYQTWRVISLAKLADGLLVVTSTAGLEIVFGTREPVMKLIAQLDIIVEDARAHPERGPMRSINLAVGGEQVPVAFVNAPPATEKKPNFFPSRVSRPELAPVRVAPTRPASRQPSAFYQPQRSAAPL